MIESLLTFLFFLALTAWLTNRERRKRRKAMEACFKAELATLVTTAATTFARAMITATPSRSISAPPSDECEIILFHPRDKRG